MMTSILKGRFGSSALGLIAALIVLSTVFWGCSKEQPSQQQTPAQGQAPQPVGVPDNVVKAKEHFMSGNQFSLKGKLDEAIKEYEESVKLNPSSPEAQNNLGFAYYDKGNIDGAVARQAAALKLNPELANAYFGLAQALEKKGDKKNAIESWKQYIKRAEPHSKYWMLAQEHVAKLEGRKMKKIKLKQPAKAQPAQPKSAK